MSQRGVRLRPVVMGIVGLTVLGVIWELVVRSFQIQPFVLQSPSEIASTLSDDPGWYLRAAGATAWHALVGLGLSLAISVAIGAVLATSRRLEEATQPVLILIMVAPWVAYFGSLRVAFGLGTTPVLILNTLVTIPAFTFAMVTGLRSVDPAAVELFDSVAASRWERLWRLRVPSAAPTVLATARFNAGLALAAAYYGEGYIPGNSLGNIGLRAIQFNDGAALWATIVITAGLGFAFLAAITIIERTALGWHTSQR